MKIFLAVALLTFSIHSWAIGRSGNGRVVDPVAGFTLAVPPSFAGAATLPNGVLRVSEPISSPYGLNLHPLLIEFRLAATEFPDLAGKSRTEAQAALSTHGYRLRSSPQTCVDAYAQESETAFTLVLLWGPVKGVVILQPKASRNESVAQGLLSTFELGPGACAWN